MRSIFFAILMFFCSMTSAVAGVSVSIGLNVPVYPQLVPVPGYPVYYAPNVSSNYFFYDGMYWVFTDDNWYASTWYNGPWGLVAPDYVPLFILRVPVSYYRYPPVYFRAWYANAPPRWGEHWGGTWEQHHRGWNNWNHAAVPAPAPLPVYQRQYSGANYPAVGQQYTLQAQNYRYQPRDAVVQQHYQTATRTQTATAPAQQSTVTAAPAPPQRREAQHPTTAPSQQVATPVPRGQPPVERSQRPANVPPPQATVSPPRAQPPVERSQRPANVPPPQATVSPPHAQPPVERNQRPANVPPPQATVSPPRAQPPQAMAHGEPQRTAAVAQQRQAPPAHEQPAPRGPQGNGPPPSRGQNQEREGGSHSNSTDR